MDIGLIGLGRMGANMARRLMNQKQRCFVYDPARASVETLSKEGAIGADSLADLVARMPAPRVLWLMVPAGAVDHVVDELAPHLQKGDVLVDGGNSYYHDDIRRSRALAERGVIYLDVGVSGGVWGLARGYCLMIGGESETVERLTPIFEALAPGFDSAPRSESRTGEATPAEKGYLHCGPSGAGHFVKMVHNGIEYGLMQAYAEGLNILQHANVGKRDHQVDAETTPLRNPEHYQYDFDLGSITEVWRRGSVISSWLLDLTALALSKDSSLSQFAGRVSDSGEGRWTLKAAIDESVPTPVLSSAVAARFTSRGEADFASRILSAMRFQFGGHEEKKA